MFIEQLVWFFQAPNNTNNIILFYGSVKYDVRMEYFLEKNGIFNYYKKKYGEERAIKEFGYGQKVKNTWIDIPSNKSSRSANTYPTEKPERLLKRIICLSTK
jgi:hypothetical protein